MNNSILLHLNKELIGVFGNRPLFNVINADISKIPFKITNRTLLIGDGKEFPLLVVKDALKAMFHYILNEEKFNFETIDFAGDLGLTDKQILNEIVFEKDKNEHFIFDNWTDFELENFKILCGNNILKNPFTKNSKHSFKDWLHINIGEFIWFEYNDITDFVTFSSYDYFKENYLENLSVNKEYNNIVSSPEEIKVFEELFSKKEKRINIRDFNNEEDEVINSDLIAGIHWNLDNVYYLFCNKN